MIQLRVLSLAGMAVLFVIRWGAEGLNIYLGKHITLPLSSEQRATIINQRLTAKNLIQTHMTTHFPPARKLGNIGKIKSGFKKWSEFECKQDAIMMQYPSCPFCPLFLVPKSGGGEHRRGERDDIFLS